MNYNNSRLNAMIQGGQWQPDHHGEMLDTYNKQAHRQVAITILAGVSSRNHYFVCEERYKYNYIKKYMIAKIYPDGHPDLQGKKDVSIVVRPTAKDSDQIVPTATNVVSSQRRGIAIVAVTATSVHVGGKNHHQITFNKHCFTIKSSQL